MIKMRFGLEDGSEHTLEEVGQYVRGHSRTHPPNRGQGAAQTASSFALAQAARIHGWGARLSSCQLPLKTAGRAD